MEASVSWKKGSTFEGTGESGYPITLVDNSSVERGVDPVELLAIALAGCTAMDVISILTKKRQKVTSFEVKVRADRVASHPQVITKAVLEYLIIGEAVDVESVVRAIDLSASKYCPVQAMLSKAFPIDMQYSIYETGQGGVPSLVEKGKYRPDK
jgi:putative redox protein